MEEKYSDLIFSVILAHIIAHQISYREISKRDYELAQSFACSSQVLT